MLDQIESEHSIAEPGIDNTTLNYHCVENNLEHNILDFWSRNRAVNLTCMIMLLIIVIIVFIDLAEGHGNAIGQREKYCVESPLSISPHDTDCAVIILPVLNN